MRRSNIVGALLLATLTACSSPKTQPAARRVETPAPVGGKYGDMSKPLRTTAFCDLAAPPPSIEDEVGFVGGLNSADGRAAAIVEVLAIGKPRWDTPDGHRPTQAQADAEIDRSNGNRVTSIYTPIEVNVVRVYKGVLPKRLTLYAEGGSLGNDAVTSCSFGPGLRIRESSARVGRGRQYLAILGNELVSDRSDGPVTHPVIVNFFEVHGTMAVGFDGRLQPLPSAGM